MRILMLTQFYPPILGGIERHVQSLSAALTQRGHQVSVFTLRHPGQLETEMDGAVKVYRVHGTLQRFSNLFSTDRFHAPPIPDPEIMRSLQRVIQLERPQVIHAHNWIVHSFLPLKAWSGAKLVMTLHDCEMSCVQMRYMYMDRTLCSRPGPIKCLSCAAHHYGALKGMATLSGNWLMRPFEQRGVDMFLPVSQAIAEVNGLLANSSTAAKVRVIPNFIPDDAAMLAEAGAQDPPLPLPDEPFILQVGDLVRDKGVYVLLNAYQALSSPPPLVLIGRRTPESPTDLPANVTLLESLPHRQVMRAWRRSLFGVVPSLCLDASPTVTLEAMACQRPVIGSRIGGITDQVVDGETGFLVTPGDETALRDAMQRLIDEPDLRRHMGVTAKERAQTFQASAVVGQIEKVYQSL